MKRLVKHTIALSSATLMALGILVSTPTIASADVVDNAEDHLDEIFEKSRTPGMSYSIVSGGDVHYGQMGVDGNGDPITESTPFLWGSLAKTVTAAVIMHMVEREEIELDDPVIEHLPSFELAEGEPVGDITIRHLLNQTSGLDMSSGGTDDFSKREDPYAAAVTDIADATLNYPPGEKHQYASSNYVLLGALIEEVRDTDFATVASRFFFQNIGYESLITDSYLATRVAPGHSYAYSQAVEIPLEYDEAGAAYGYVGGTIEQLTAFATMLLNQGEYEGVQYLQPESVDMMVSETVELSDSMDYGLGIRVHDYNEDLGERTYWHGGAVNGYIANMVLLPDSGQAVVMMRNIYGLFHDGELSFDGVNAARVLAGGQPIDTPRDSSYPYILFGLSALVLILTALIGWTLWRFWRIPRPTERRGRLLAFTIGFPLLGLFLAGMMLYVPASVGASLSLARMWATDVGWLMTTVLALSAVIIPLWAVGGPIRVFLNSRAEPEPEPSDCDTADAR